jgi:PadR family transcriptional regulator PadR
MAEKLEFMRGTVDVLLLKALAWGPLHGYAITGFLRERTGGAFELEEGALYHALHRLDRRGLVRSEWGLSENNRRARYYQLTREGRTELQREVTRWKRYASAVFAVLETA